MGRFIERFVDRPLEELSGREVGEELLALAQRHRMRMPAPLALLLKAVIMMEGIGVLIDPQLDVFGIARPFAARALAEAIGPEAVARQALEHSRELAEVVGSLPRQVGVALQQLNDGELTLRTHDLEARRSVAALARAGERVALALVVLASTVGLGLLALAAAIGGWSGSAITLALALCVVALFVSCLALFGSLLRRE
jgi:ubiquinone biosynthesis protein